MKTSKNLLLLLAITLLVGCSNQQTQMPQPIVAPPTQTTPFLDFDHPRLHEIAGNKPLIIDEIVRTSRNQEPKYVAVIIETDSPFEGQKMLLFRLSNPEVALIYETEVYSYMSFNTLANESYWPVDNNNYFFYKTTMGEIYSIDEDYLVVPFVASMGGNCYDCGGMKVIGITKNGIASDITPASGFVAKSYVDIKGNFQFEIFATHYYEFDYGACVHAASPFAFRLYKWQDSAYVDVSKDEKEFYDQKISGLVRSLQENYNKPLDSCLVMPTLANIFFDYESSGRVEYGWEKIQALGDLSHWDIQNTPPEEIQTYHEVFDELEQRKNQDLTTATP